jgi:signal transduction histidine kinase
VPAVASPPAKLPAAPRVPSRPLLRDVAQATLAARLLVVTALIVLYLRTPNTGAPAWAMGVLAGAVLYGFGLTVYGAQSADRAGQAARWALPGDVALLWIGMLITAAPIDFVFLGFPLVVVAGLLNGYGAGGVAAAALALVQLPGLPSSVFTPARWIDWMLLTFGLVAAAGAAGAAAHRLTSRQRVARAISEIDTAVSLGSPAAAAVTILEAAAAHFHAASGVLALLDPVAGHLDVLASVGATPASLGAGPEAGESLAGWVAQGGRAVLLTPGAQFPLHVPSTLVRSSMCVACAVAGRPTGVLILHRGAGEPEFTREDLDDAQLLAAAAAPYLLRVHNERMWSAALTTLAGGHAKVGYALTRDPVVLWPALLDLIRSLTSARCAVLALEQEETGNVEIVAARGLNGVEPRALLPSLIAAITMGEIQRPGGTAAANSTESPPAESPPSMTYVPLLVGSRVIGALGLDAPDSALFSGTLLPALVSHIAAAVDTARTAHRVADIGAAEERHRIAREIHDGLAQTLANALLQTDMCAAAAQSAPSSLARELTELRSLLEQAMREMRQFMAELRRTEGGDDRLVAALERLAREMERRHHLAVSVTASGDDAHLPPAVRHALLAITRQALANVQAHARATRATIRAQITGEWCALSVADNGIGFDVHAYRAGPAAGHHLGLPSMEERAGLVGGRLVIDSEPARGTTITVQVPLGVRHG